MENTVDKNKEILYKIIGICETFFGVKERKDYSESLLVEKLKQERIPYNIYMVVTTWKGDTRRYRNIRLFEDEDFSVTSKLAMKELIDSIKNGGTITEDNKAFSRGTGGYVFYKPSQMIGTIKEDERFEDTYKWIDKNIVDGAENYDIWSYKGSPCFRNNLNLLVENRFIYPIVNLKKFETISGYFGVNGTGVKIVMGIPFEMK